MTHFFYSKKMDNFYDLEMRRNLESPFLINVAVLLSLRAERSRRCSSEYNLEVSMDK